MNEKNDLFSEDDVIFRYTRKQAIEDGVLVDLTAWAKETGFRIPVACTRTVWDQYVVPPKATEGYGQSERGRCHDLLWMCYVAIRKGSGGSLLHYKCLFLQEPDKHEEAELKAVCGPGDEGEPVLTIMRPDED